MPLPARAVQCTTGKTLVNPQAIANQTVAAINHFVVAAKITFSAFANMENNRLWEDGKYKCASWSSGNLLPRNRHEERRFWDDVAVAEGSCWTQNAKSGDSVDACTIFWNEKRVN